MQEEEKYFFDSGELLNAVFAGELSENLRKSGEKLQLRLLARDSWVKTLSGTKDDFRRLAAFLDSLLHFYNSNPDSFDQHDFENVLAAHGNDRSAELHTSYSERIKVSPRKKDVIPRTGAQLNYVRSIRKKDIVFGIGPAGTGKTYLAMAMAVSSFLAGDCARIILTRPAREAGENLGFLPGNLQEKILPYLRPLYDALYEMMEFEQAATLMEKNIIEVAPLAYMRGRTLNNAFVILDEAQNATRDQMFMFLTRLGFNSRCVVTGDPSQTDLPENRKSGLLHSSELLKGIDEIGFCFFSAADAVRHPLVERIINAYQGETR